jgi:FAD:protein FMN transferase
MSATSAAGARILVQRSGRPMATDVSVQIAAEPAQEAAAHAAADACMVWFDEVDSRLSRFQPESELSRLNRSAGRWFAASGVLYEALAVAVAFAHASGGLFDPTLLPQLEALGYDRDFDLIARREIAQDDDALHATPPLPPAPAWRSIEIDPNGRRVRLPKGSRLDLGGIAKGWAADVALARYCAPFPGALVNVGGDLRVRGGPAPGAAWSAGIRDPRGELAATPAVPTYVASVTFSRGGLATSGALRRWWLRNGERRHHLLDPRTGSPMRVWIDQRDTPADGAGSPPLIATATALAPTAAHAEVAAKVALLRGYPDALRTVEAAWERYGAVGPETDADAGVALVLTFGNGEVAISQNLSTFLATWGTDGAPLPMAVPPFPSHRQ